MEILSLRPPPFERDEIKKAQHRRNYASISMSESIITNIATMQRRRFYANILMNESTMTKVLTTQLGTSCSFDSPGLARNEPTPGKHSQGDSTPSVLSFFYEDMVITRRLMAD